MVDDKVQYPFKTLNNIFEKDLPGYPLINLEDHHKLLSSFRLTEKVPLSVRQLFDTAKNICLYSFFAYRLHQPSEMIAYSALEMALRIRAKASHPELFKDARKAPTLWTLTSLAKKEGWLSSEKYHSRRPVAEERIRHEKLHNQMLQRLSGNILDWDDSKPMALEVDEMMRRMNIADIFLSTTPMLRNDLAHGSETLAPSSFNTLELVSETINQLFN